MSGQPAHPLDSKDPGFAGLTAAPPSPIAGVPDAHSAAPYRLKPFAGSPHSWAIGIGRQLRPGERLRVLDIGAATGLVGSALRAERDGQANLTGIEVEVEARAELERRYDRVLGSLDALPEGERFDVALLLDVIEHTPDPVAVLRRAASALDAGGVLLVSVPNVAHWSVRLSLLFGRFEYQNSGTLDRTHLRFFTRRSYRRTLEAAGLVLEQEAFAIEPIELLWPALEGNVVWRGLRHVRRGIAWAWPGLFAFQLLARCRVK